MEIFDKEDVYDKEISPLVNKIIAICKANEIPMLASFVFEETEDEGTGMATTYINGFGRDSRFAPVLHQALAVIKGPSEPSAAFTIRKGL